MTKTEFLSELRNHLKGLPEQDLEDRLTFYGEMIDDRVEEGKPEAEAVAEIGSVEEVASQILSETPLMKLVKEKAKPKRRMAAWEIVLIILGFPLWFPLLTVAMVLLLVAYTLIWVMVVVVYAVELSFIVGTIWGIVMFFATGCNALFLGGAMVSAGLAIFMGFACAWAPRGAVKLAKCLGLGIKRLFVRGGNKQ